MLLSSPCKLPKKIFCKCTNCISKLKSFNRRSKHLYLVLRSYKCWQSAIKFLLNDFCAIDHQNRVSVIDISTAFASMTLESQNINGFKFLEGWGFQSPRLIFCAMTKFMSKLRLSCIKRRAKYAPVVRFSYDYRKTEHRFLQFLRVRFLVL